MFGFNRQSRSNLAKNIGSRVSPAINANGIDAVFQQGPLRLDDLNTLLGSSDDFISRFEDFESKYFAALSDPANLNIGKNVDIDAVKAAGEIDFKLLNIEARSRLKEEFLFNVMRMDRAIGDYGLPGEELPSTNLYRGSYRFRTLLENGEAHAGAAMFNTLNLQHIPYARDDSIMGSLSIPNKIIGSRRLKQVSDPEDFKRIMDNASKVITFDTETTGVYRGAQVRSMAMTSQGFDFAYDAPGLGGITVNGEQFSSFIARQEGIRNVATTQLEFLDYNERFINELLTADVISGHNIGFDIRMMSESLSQIKGHENHGAFNALSNLHSAINEGRITVVDTADVARNYLKNRAESLVQSGIPLEAQSRAFINSLYSADTLAKVVEGGSATYADVGNIVTNTNILDLMEAQGGTAQRLVREIASGTGTHAAHVDIQVQSYIAEAMRTGDLKLQAEISGYTPSVLVRGAQKVVASSAAVTATTNIADPTQLSSTARAYVKSSRGLMGVSAIADASNLGLTGVTGEGNLRYIDGGYNFIQGGTQTLVDKSVAESHLRNLIDNNDSNIRSLGISYRSASAAEEIGFNTAITQPTNLTREAILDAYGSVYQNFGTMPGTADRYSAFRGERLSESVFEAGLARFDQQSASRVSSLFANIGDPFSYLDVRSRVFSTVVASSTAKVGESLASDIAPKFASYASLLAESGVGYFGVSTSANIVGDVSTTAAEAAGVARMQLPTEIARNAMRRALGDDAAQFDNLTISLTSNNADTAQMRLVYNTDDLTRRQKLVFTQSIMEQMESASSAAQAMGIAEDELSENVIKQINLLHGEKTSKGRKYVRDLIYNLSSDNGVIIGESQVSRDTMSQLDNIGFESESDVTLKGYRARSMQISDEADKAVIATTPFEDQTAARIAGTADESLAASRAMRDSMEAIAETIDDQGIQRALRRKVGRGSIGLSENLILDVYNNIKPKANLIGLGAAALGAAYYMTKRNQEVSLYNETLEPQPYQKGSTVSDYNSSSARFVDTSSTRSDPLFTSGVVGNLDRSKIGHTNMGSKKNNHLFGGF